MKPYLHKLVGGSHPSSLPGSHGWDRRVRELLRLRLYRKSLLRYGVPEEQWDSRGEMPSAVNGNEQTPPPKERSEAIYGIRNSLVTG